MPARARRVASVPLTVALLGALVAGCTPSNPSGDARAGSDGGATPAPTATDDGAATPAPASYPLTLDNCGFEVTLDEAPQRVVAIKSSAIETVLALGAGDRLVGTGFPDGPVPDRWAADGADVPLLSDRVPAAEVVLGTEPDLVLAGWESALTGEGAGDRRTLADLGVATYVPTSACTDPAYQPDRLTFDDVFAQITEVGTVLGEPEAAAALVAEQEAQLADVEPDDRGLTALWWSSGTDVPFVGGGIGAPQMLMEAAGLTNVAEGLEQTWSSYSWEQVAADDPDVIVLVDAAWNPAQRKKEQLAANPVTAELTAVRAERYLVVPFAATEAGVRSVEAAGDLAEQLGAVQAP